MGSATSHVSSELHRQPVELWPSFEGIHRQLCGTSIVRSLRAASWSHHAGEERTLRVSSRCERLVWGSCLPQTLPHVSASHHDSVDCPRGRATVTPSSSSTSNRFKLSHRLSGAWQLSGSKRLERHRLGHKPLERHRSEHTRLERHRLEHNRSSNPCCSSSCEPCSNESWASRA